MRLGPDRRVRANYLLSFGFSRVRGLNGVAHVASLRSEGLSALTAWGASPEAER